MFDTDIRGSLGSTGGFNTLGIFMGSAISCRKQRECVRSDK